MENEIAGFTCAPDILEKHIITETKPIPATNPTVNVVSPADALLLDELTIAPNIGMKKNDVAINSPKTKNYQIK
jgi:hypothetical protein